jgi:hypothetical protein
MRAHHRADLTMKRTLLVEALPLPSLATNLMM